ncbi:MAG: 30S ribosomal protein S6 [Ardenticatenaceae bacterium]
MDMEELRRYELYVIFQPDLDAEQLEAEIDRLNGYLVSNESDIIEVARKGKRRLAYPIRKYTQGIDVIYQLYYLGPRIPALERVLNLNENLIRYLMIRRDDLGTKEKKIASQEPVPSEAAATPMSAPPTDVFDLNKQPIVPTEEFNVQPDFPDLSWD